MQTIEFSFDSFDGRELNIIATIDDNQIHFKTFENGKKISNGSLTTLDFKHIEEFIKENAEDDIENEGDLYDRQND